MSCICQKKLTLRMGRDRVRGEGIFMLLVLTFKSFFDCQFRGCLIFIHSSCQVSFAFTFFTFCVVALIKFSSSFWRKAFLEAPMIDCDSCTFILASRTFVVLKLTRYHLAHLSTAGFSEV